MVDLSAFQKALDSEYTYELAWKTLKRYLDEEGVQETAAFSKKDLFREAAARKLVLDPTAWFSYQKARNETSHTYDTLKAAQVHRDAVAFRTTPGNYWKPCGRRLGLMIDLDSGQLQIVKEILYSHALEYPIYAFGSRVRGQAKQFSDLDLMIRSDRPLCLEIMGELRWAFSDSDLPIKVDVLDWSEVNDSFRRLIEKDWEQIFP